MGAGSRLRFAPQTRLVRSQPGQVVVERGSCRLPIDDLGVGTQRALRLLEDEGGDVETLAQPARRDGAPALLRFLQILEDLHACNLLSRLAPSRGEPVVIFEPFICPAPRPAGTLPPPRVAFSRFALLRRQDGVLRMESPLAHGVLLPHGPEGASLLARLMVGPFDRPAVVQHLSDLGVVPTDPEADTEPDMQADVLLDLLWQSGFLTAVDGDGRAAEDLDPSLQQWEAHDLLFHARSRAGRHDFAYGSTFPFRGRVEPLPAVSDLDAGAEWIELQRPDLQHLLEHDPPFTAVLESRTSRRTPGSRPVTRRRLGELLFRTSRFRRLDTSGDCETSHRVYPGGGALYELEIYPVVGRCDGLDPGIYRYDPAEHGLFSLCGPSDESRALLKAAGQTAQAPAPDILLVFTARFQRISWKYRSMAYAGILKNLGVLYQTFYLVATAMGLRICALGGGNADLFAHATGRQYTTESSVGEMILNGDGGGGGEDD